MGTTTSFRIPPHVLFLPTLYHLYYPCRAASAASARL